MGKSRNGRNKRHTNYRYVNRSATEKQKRLRVAKQIRDEEIFTGEVVLSLPLILKPGEKPKVLTKIGDTWVVS